MFLADVSLATIGLVSAGVLAWLMCAFTAGGIARNNGESYHLWLLVGLLTGPLGLIFTYLYFQVTGERHRRSRYGIGGKSDVPEMVKCPNCGQHVPLSFDSCQFCGEPLTGGGRR